MVDSIDSNQGNIDFGGKDSGGGFNFSSQAGAAGALGLAGLALDFFGTKKASEAQHAASQESQNQVQDEMQINAQKRQQMNLDFQRQSLQNLRQTQQARSASMAASVASGSQFGSGVAGGQGQIAAQAADTTRDLGQNLQIGTNIFNLTDQISLSKIKEAQDESNASSAKGMMAFGSDLLQVAGIAAKFIPL